MADASYQPGVYREQGGNRLVVVSGTGNLELFGTDLTATGAEINSGVDVSAQTDTMSASTVMAATVATYTTAVVRHGPIIETTIYVDLTGAKSTTTDLDIIGDTGACHIGQVTAAINGAIFAGEIHCGEVPTTGVNDIDLYEASVATGAYDADASGLTNAAALVTNGGAHAIGTVAPFTALPNADYYLYLAAGAAGTPGTYDAGILVIRMWGLAA
jgi:hypothetical protein